MYKPGENSRKPRLCELLNVTPGFNPSKINNDAVRDAVRRHPEAVKEKFTFNVPPPREVYPIFIAVALRASLDVIELLYESFQEALQETDVCGQTPLHYSCTFKAPIDVVRRLVEYYPGAVKLRDKRGRTPIHEACASGASVEVMGVLLARYPRALEEKDKHGHTPRALAGMSNVSKDVLSLLQDFSDAIETGRNTMERALDSSSNPGPVTKQYLQYCTDGFSGGRYLGEGSFGRVYVGVDRVIRRKFAVKRFRMKISDGNEEEARRTFERELATFERIRHPHIARLHGYYWSNDSNGDHCLIFELASNGSLYELLNNSEQKQKLHWTTRIKIALHVSLALKYLHMGMAGYTCVHRDVKSANICLKRDFKALLIDCGLCKMIPEEESYGTMSIMNTPGNSVRGTPGYICPFYAITRKYSTASDIFSLGIVFIEIFTGVLQPRQFHGNTIEHFFRYGIDFSEALQLEMDADKLAGEWDESVRRSFAELAIECISIDPKIRPSIDDIVARLSDLAGKSKPASPGNTNHITVLFSDPLVWKDDSGSLHPTDESLDIGWERQALTRCVLEAKRDISLHFDVATDIRFQAAATRRCGCLHITSHGHQNKLVFEDGQGGTHLLDDHEISDRVHREPFKFVFISACHSRSIGAALVKAGVPHVVCCELDKKLRDDAAIQFTQGFYHALFEQYTVKDAFEKGKLAVSRRYPLEEAQKYVLLPEGGNHDHVIFDADLLEWEEEPETTPFIPLPPQCFLGRKVDQYNLLNEIRSQQFVTLVGGEGVGCSSLASAVCHFIAERKSTIFEIEDVYFVRAKTDGHETSTFESFLLPLQNKLVAEGKAGQVQDGALRRDVLCISIFQALAGAKALVVFDGVNANDGVLVDFLRSLFYYTNTTKVMLTARQPVGFSSASVKEKCFFVRNLDADNAARLFVKKCRHADTAVRERALELLLFSDTSPDTCASLKEDIANIIYGGVPAEVVDAADNLSRDEYDTLFSMRCDYDTAVAIFANTCKAADTSAKRLELHMLLLSDAWSSSSPLCSIILDGVPSRLVVAAQVLSKEEYDKLFSKPINHDSAARFFVNMWCAQADKWDRRHDFICALRSCCKCGIFLHAGNELRKDTFRVVKEGVPSKIIEEATSCGAQDLECLVEEYNRQNGATVRSNVGDMPISSSSLLTPPSKGTETCDLAQLDTKEDRDMLGSETLPKERQSRTPSQICAGKSRHEKIEEINELVRKQTTKEYKQAAHAVTGALELSKCFASGSSPGSWTTSILRQSLMLTNTPPALRRKDGQQGPPSQHSMLVFEQKFTVAEPRNQRLLGSQHRDEEYLYEDGSIPLRFIQKISEIVRLGMPVADSVSQSRIQDHTENLPRCTIVESQRKQDFVDILQPRQYNRRDRILKNGKTMPNEAEARRESEAPFAIAVSNKTVHSPLRDSDGTGHSIGALEGLSIWTMCVLVLVDLIVRMACCLSSNEEGVRQLRVAFLETVGLKVDCLDASETGDTGEQDAEPDLVDEVVAMKGRDPVCAVDQLSKTSHTLPQRLGQIGSLKDELKPLGRTLSLFGRFNVENVDPMLVSSTAIVLNSLDCENDAAVPVALKLMCNREAVLAELNGRVGVDEKFVVAVRQVLFDATETDLTCAGEVPVVSKEGLADVLGELLSRIHQPKLESNCGPFKYVLVLDRADCTLHQVLQEHRLETLLHLVRHIVTDICNALDDLHSNVRIHADLKPLNIVRVGISWKLTGLDVSCSIGKPLGTLKKPISGYFPPEMAKKIRSVNRNRGSDYKAHRAYDLWSLGCVLFELLLGSTLWKMRSDASLPEEELEKLATWSKLQCERKMHAILPRNRRCPDLIAGLDLVCKLLEPDADARCAHFEKGMLSVLDHPFLNFTYHP